MCMCVCNVPTCVYIYVCIYVCTHVCIKWLIHIRIISLSLSLSLCFKCLQNVPVTGSEDACLAIDVLRPSCWYSYLNYKNTNTTEKAPWAEQTTDPIENKDSRTELFISHTAAPNHSRAYRATSLRTQRSQHDDDRVVTWRGLDVLYKGVSGQP